MRRAAARVSRPAAAVGQGREVLGRAVQAGDSSFLKHGPGEARRELRAGGPRVGRRGGAKAGTQIASRVPSVAVPAVQILKAPSGAFASAGRRG